MGRERNRQGERGRGERVVGRENQRQTEAERQKEVEIWGEK